MPKPAVFSASHVVYGGAHLFSERTPQKLAELALSAFDQYYPPQSSGDARVHSLVREKLKTRAVESIRIDFEDGFGTRSDAEEDEHAERTAKELAKIATSETATTTGFGLRVRAWNGSTSRRAARTLDVFCTHLTREIAAKPSATVPNLVVTLPKVTKPSEVESLVLELRSLEAKLSLPTIGIELMAETKEAASRRALESFIAAGEGRVRSLHLGAYDFLSELGVPSRAQKLHHPFTDELRAKMLLATAGTDVTVFDGATTTLPIDKSKDRTSLTEAQIAENHARVVSALVIHASDVAQSIDKGFFGSWILYPAQLVSHAIAMQTYYLEEVDRARARLANFVEKAARATSVDQAFDDRATARGLTSFFARGLAGGWIATSDLGSLAAHEAHLRASDVDALARAARGSG